VTKLGDAIQANADRRAS